MKRIVYTVCRLSIIGGLLLFGSCKKNDPVPLSKEQLLTSVKGWKVSAETIAPAILGISDYFSTLSQCDKDNILKFKIDGSYTEDEGATKCDPSDPQLADSGSWKFNADKTSITSTSADQSSAPESIHVVSLTSSTFIVSKSIEESGISYVITVTLIPAL